MVSTKSWMRSSRAQRNLSAAKSAVSAVSSNMFEIIEMEELDKESEPMKIVYEANDICNKIDDLQKRVSKLYSSQYKSLTEY